MRRARFPFCIGNYPEGDRPILEQAIAETGFPVFIKDTATDSHGRSMPGYISLWSRTLDDTTPFLDVYRQLKAK